MWITRAVLLVATLSVAAFAADFVTGDSWDVFDGGSFQVRTTRTSSRVCDGEEGVAGYVDWGK